MKINNYNQAYNNNIKFSGLQSAMPVKNIDTLINETVTKLLQRTEKEIPEYGTFKQVFESFKNPDKTLTVTDFMLKITPNDTKGAEKERYLKLVAYNLPNPYISEVILTRGEKETILKKLKDDNLINEIKDKLVGLSDGLKDAER